MTTPILVTGAAGRVGAVGRTVTEMLLKQGKAVRAMVRNEDERAQALRDTGAEVVVGDLLDLNSLHRVIAGCETMYFGMSVSDTYLAATVESSHCRKSQEHQSEPSLAMVIAVAARIGGIESAKHSVFSVATKLSARALS